MEKSQEERDSYVQELHGKVIEGDACALEELSKIAMGGASQLARDLINKTEDRMVTKHTENQTWGPGVPKEAWSKNDQERMERGELPEGTPLHPNI
ncbi:hypothetical protein KKE60_00345 [Patescibacteria group bacterium]|nr:hypothetical protein [Patescibacteria group bacterium]